MGIVGIETAFPLLYTYLVLKGELSLARLIELLSDAPRRRFGLPVTLSEDAPADFTVFDLEDSYEIDPGTFLSKGRSTPFAGRKVQGRCVLTVADGKTAYEDRERLCGAK